jgi:phospholipid/cholesterol/gamma-HCH transport system permease protein
MTIMLTAIGVAVAIGVGTLTAALAFHVNPHAFLDVSKVERGDVVLALVKCAAYGAAVPIVSAWCGLRARGGSEGVGTATTRAVIGSSFAVLALDLILSAIGVRFLQGGGAG